MNGEKRESIPGCTCDDTLGCTHSCPYTEEIQGITDDSECDCCAACERECGADI